MKLKILSGIIGVGLATCAFGQEITIDNTVNSGGSGATSNGQVYEQIGASTALFDGFNYNLGIAVYGGTSVGSLSLIVSDTPLNDVNGYTGSGPGQFLVNNDASYTVPGVAAGGIAVLELQIWDYNSPNATGTFESYAAAVAAHDPAAQVIFNQTTGGPLTTPPSPASLLTLMPSVILTTVPEPTTFAIAGLGIASLLAFRRRNA